MQTDLRKFQPTKHLAYQVERPDVVEKVLASPHTPLTIIQAPAGYGKSTILLQTHAKLVHDKEIVAWMNCGTIDREPEILFSNLQQALASAADTFRTCSRSLGAIIEAINKSTSPITIIFDDYDALVSSKADGIIELLVSNFPRNCQLLIGTRSTDEAKIAKLVLEGTAKIIDAEALTFKPPEIASLLAPYCTTETIERLTDVAEGWPVVIQLARIKAEHETNDSKLLASILRPNSEVFGFLANEVLSSLTAEQRDLLTKCSIVDAVNPDIARVLTDNDKAHSVLSEIVRLQPLVNVELNSPLTIRLHPVLREYLLMSLANMGASITAQLNVSVAQYYAKNKEPFKAIEHATAAGNSSLSCDILEEVGGPLAIMDYGPAAIWSLLDHLPRPRIDRRAALSMIRLLKTVVNGNDLQLQESAFVIDQKLENSPNISPFPNEELYRLSQYIVLIISDCWSPVIDRLDNLSESLEIYVRRKAATDPRVLAFYLPFRFFLEYRYGSLKRAEEIVLEYERICDGNGYASNLPSISPHMGMIAFGKADFQSALHFFSMNLTHHWDRFVGREELLIKLGNSQAAKVLYEQNHIEDSIANIKAIGSVLEASFRELIEAQDVTYAYCLLRRNDVDYAIAHLDEALQKRELYGLNNMIPAIQCTKVSILLMSGNVTEANQIFDQHGLFSKWQQEEPHGHWDWNYVEAFVRAYIPLLIACEQFEEALSLSTLVQKKAALHGRQLIVALANVYASLAHMQNNDSKNAKICLVNALSIHAIGGAIRPYIDSGGGLIPLLQEINKDDVGEGVLMHVASVLNTWQNHIENSAFQNFLTARESDVLVELTKGFPTKIIARNLKVAPETVKYHLKNIFKKLDVDSRSDAISEAYRRTFIV